MRPWVREFVRLATEQLAPRGPVYEFGAYLVEGQTGLANLRSLFPGREYVGCDQRPGPGVDRLEDLGGLSLNDGAAGTILCLDTLEHVFEVRRAADEMLRVLAPGGVLIWSVPLDFRVHAFPDDYWRLTPACVERLLAPLGATMVGSVGVESFPHTVLAIGAKPPLPAGWPAAVENLAARYQDWLATVARGPGWTSRLGWWATAWMHTRRERRRRREFFTARFASRWSTAATLVPTPTAQQGTPRRAA